MGTWRPRWDAQNMDPYFYSSCVSPSPGGAKCAQVDTARCARVRRRDLHGKVWALAPSCSTVWCRHSRLRSLNEPAGQ